MSQILVRNLDPETVERLKMQAKLNRRSLQAEVKVILEQAARRRPTPERMRELNEIMDRIREQAGPQATDSVDIVRAMRGNP